MLFDGETARRLGDWVCARGLARMGDGCILLGRPGLRSTVLLMGQTFKNGVLEFDVFRRREPAAPGRGGQGPYTFGLRCGGSLLSWRSIYVVCRPGRVEICAGTTDDQTPAPEAAAKIPTTTQPERWRIVMADNDITCFRLGEKVLTYTDPAPRDGTVAVTADNCTLELRAVSYRPLEK